MKKRILIAVVIMLSLATIGMATGILPFTIQFGDCFFTNKYYKTSISAYNAENDIDAIYGDVSAEKEIGLFELDNENALFSGELKDGNIVIAEMKVKNNKYAYAGTYSIFDMSKDLKVDGTAYYQTKTADGYAKWAVVYKESDIEKYKNVNKTEHFTASDGRDIFLLILE